MLTRCGFIATAGFVLIGCSARGGGSSEAREIARHSWWTQGISPSKIDKILDTLTAERGVFLVVNRDGDFQMFDYSQAMGGIGQFAADPRGENMAMQVLEEVRPQLDALPKDWRAVTSRGRCATRADAADVLRSALRRDSLGEMLKMTDAEQIADQKRKKR